MTRTHVRLGLVAVGALLALLVTIQPGHSQPGPPGPPGGGIRGGPSNFPKPPGPGMPGPGGIRGGISGTPGRPPGFPEVPRPPDFRPPEIPRPPGIGRRPGIGGGDIYDWSCSACGRHLGTGRFPPPVRVCPGCGARLEGSEIVDGPGAGGRPPGMTPPGPVIPPAPGFGRPGFENPPDMVGPGRPAGLDQGVYVPANPPAPSNSRSAALKVVGITMGVLLLLGIVLAVVVVAILKQRPVRRRRARRRYDDEDDDF